MTVRWLGDGSAVCNGDFDPSRTATYGPPKDGTTQKASIAAFFALEPAPGPDNSPDGLRASIPTAASSTPPAVADASAVGSAALYARSDHTHAGKARKSIVTGVNTATYTWTYPTAFGAGVVPVIQALVNDPSNTAADNYNIQTVGTPTSTQAQFRIIRQTVALGILGINASPGTVTLHLTALEP